MLKEKLKPYILKEKGKDAYALYDILNGELYLVEKEGDLEELRRSLKDNGLIFETTGIVPFKFYLNIENLYGKNTTRLREITIRINGGDNGFCWDRQFDNNNKNKIDFSLFLKSFDGLKGFVFEKLTIEVGDFNEKEVKKYIKLINPDLVVIKIYKKTKLNIKDKLFFGKKVKIKKIRNEEKKKLIISEYDYFFNKLYNSCLGYIISIDSNGDIKPCLWIKDVLGNISNKKIIDILRSKKLKAYWNISMRFVNMCKECELKYGCRDCRAEVINRGGEMKEKSDAICYKN